jgi:hypothetical protein
VWQRGARIVLPDRRLPVDRVSRALASRFEARRSDTLDENPEDLLALALSNVLMSLDAPFAHVIGRVGKTIGFNASGVLMAQNANVKISGQDLRLILPHIIERTAE